MNSPVVAITGASGYLGGQIRDHLRSLGLPVVSLVRSPADDPRLERRYDLASPVPPDLLASVDVLVHAAYDFGLTSRAAIWRVNVEGSRRLLAAAQAAGVRRVIVVSSMSAYEGTTQRYGQAKLAIEAAAAAYGGCVVRPGLVYGDAAGGMIGALRAAVHLPLVPLVGGTSRQYPVHEDDVTAAIGRLVLADELPDELLGIAPPSPVSFRQVLEHLAAGEGRAPRFVPVPWQVLFFGLRCAELLRVAVPFRSDSLLGLVRPAPDVPGADALHRLGIALRPFPSGREELARAEGAGR
jgi:nucleoside-diphosphate-sugar epimerase